MPRARLVTRPTVSGASLALAEAFGDGLTVGVTAFNLEFLMRPVTKPPAAMTSVITAEMAA